MMVATLRCLDIVLREVGPGLRDADGVVNPLNSAMEIS